MNYTVAVALLLFFFSGALQSAPSGQQDKSGNVSTSETNIELPKGLFPNGSEVLVGSVVRYDASMSSRTSQADLALRLKTEGESKYIRLRYAPNGFGFDAPPATAEQLLPKEMFSDGRLVWIFHVHAPRNREEESACTSRAKQYAPDKKGHLVEIERFSPIPGKENDKTPNPESLSCLVMESWSKSTDTVDPATGNLRVTVPLVATTKPSH